MSQYGKVACLAAKRARNSKKRAWNSKKPRQAWEKSAKEVFPDKPASQDKDCPRSAFLGLAEDGLIVGIPSGNYTKSQDSKRYAIAGVDLLRKEPALCDCPRKMWYRIMGKNKKHNNQMEVVAALWKNGDIKDSV